MFSQTRPQKVATIIAVLGAVILAPLLWTSSLQAKSVGGSLSSTKSGGMASSPKKDRTTIKLPEGTILGNQLTKGQYFQVKKPGAVQVRVGGNNFILVNSGDYLSLDCKKASFAEDSVTEPDKDPYPTIDVTCLEGSAILNHYHPSDDSDPFCSGTCYEKAGAYMLSDKTMMFYGVKDDHLSIITDPSSSPGGIAALPQQLAVPTTMKAFKDLAPMGPDSNVKVDLTHFEFQVK